MMGKALSGELSCPCDRSCYLTCVNVQEVLLHSFGVDGHGNIVIKDFTLKCLSIGTPNTTIFPNGK